MTAINSHETKHQYV